jgi:hypothetical protein
MSFRIIIEINPHPDNVRCGECQFLGTEDFGYQYCGVFNHCFGDDNPVRVPACIEAEKKGIE